ncbi:MAG TPA: S16 family serine protease [Candidatus Bilamarchaeaceae archaeon]|nr:S16 family serine protease [Candidatus Bilamarchaeaceae archaeon]
MRLPYYLLAFLLFLPMASSACTGSESIFVPAIVESGGSLVEMIVRLVPGDGDIYITTYPYSAVSTQVSVHDAVLYGFEAAGEQFGTCDVLVKIEGGNVASYVEGPSAGMALSVLTYAALKEEPLLEDATITGAVASGGDIERAGGIYEKALAAAQNGMRYFVIPRASIHERILLMPIKKSYDIQIIEVTHTDQAIDFLAHGVFPPEPELLAENQGIPRGIIPYSDPRLEPFHPLAERMIAQEQSVVDALPAEEEEQEVIRSFYIDDIARQQFLLDQGYVFTAANEAFLGYIDAVTIIASQDVHQLDLYNKQAAIAQCLNNLPEKFKTDENFEWLIAADLRKAWAEERLQSVDPEMAELLEEKYILFNQLEYGEAWCFVSQQLRELSPAPGLTSPAIDENAFQMLALENLQAVGEVELPSIEIQEHARSSRLLYNQGKYAASLYDSTFVLSFQETQEDWAALSDTELNNRTEQLLQENYSSVWARIYQSHAVYLNQENDSNSITVYQLLLYAHNLDSIHTQMVELLSDRPPSTLMNTTLGAIPTVPVPTYQGPSECFPSYILAIILFSTVILWTRR